MTKTELTRAVHERLQCEMDITHGEVKLVLDAIIIDITGAVEDGQSVNVTGLCKFKPVDVAAKPRRKGMNPFTKEEQWFAAKPASTRVKIQPLKPLKDAAVAGGKKRRRAA